MHRLLGRLMASVQFACWSLYFLKFFLRFSTARIMVRARVRYSVSFSVCKPGVEWKVGCQEQIYQNNRDSSPDQEFARPE